MRTMWRLLRAPVAIVLLSTIAWGQPLSGPKPVDPIAFIGHGAAFDTEGRQINITPEFIRGAHAYYFATLSERASPSQRKAIAQRRNALSGIQMESMQAQLYANATLLDWFLQETRPSNYADLRSKAKFLKRYLQFEMPVGNRPASLGIQKRFTATEGLRKQLIDARLLEEVSSADTQASREAYIKDCAAAGVPTPPDWGDARWLSKGLFNQPFISTELENVEVFVYDSVAPEGVCLALPRSMASSADNQNPDIELLGIICTGKATSNVCFWDNQQNDTGTPIKAGTQFPLTGFAGGSELEGGDGGVCTSCHAGENPYVVHPKTALGLPNLKDYRLKMRPDAWYRPLVAQSWPQNPGPSTLLDAIDSPSGCNECHTQKGSGGRLPKVSTALDQYCKGVLMNAIERTMPPGKTGTDPDPDYALHIDALLAACKSPP